MQYPPNGINPQEVIFEGERVEQGTLYLVRDVLEVLKAHETTLFEAAMGPQICDRDRVGTAGDRPLRRDAELAAPGRRRLTSRQRRRCRY